MHDEWNECPFHTAIFLWKHSKDSLDIEDATTMAKFEGETSMAK